MPAIVQEKFKEQKYIIPVFQVLQYSGFTNQPNNDGVEVVSSDAADTQLCTIWGTDQDGDYQYETVAMTGTTPVSTTRTDWENIVGIFLGDVYGKNSVVAVGTITIREASGDAAITTIVAGDRSTGNVRFLIDGSNVSILNMSGNLYYNASDWATTDNSFKLTTGMSVDQKISQYLTFHSDGSGAETQIAVWED